MEINEKKRKNARCFTIQKEIFNKAYYGYIIDRQIEDIPKIKEESFQDDTTSKWHIVSILYWNKYWFII